MAVSMMTTSPNGLMSAFSPYSDSPSSPGHNSTVSRKSPAPANPNGDKSKHLSAPNATTTTVTIAVPHAGVPVGLDIIDPSPVAPSSTGTEFTDMEEAQEEEEQPGVMKGSNLAPRSPPSAQSALKIKTDTPRVYPSVRPRSTAEDYADEPLSVIHAPPGFQDFINPTANERASTRVLPTTTITTSITSPTPPSEPNDPATDLERANISPSQRSDATVTSPVQPDHKDLTKRGVYSPVSPPPLTTTLPRGDWKERPTPQAQTRQEAEASQRHLRSASLEDIPEAHDTELPILELDTESASKAAIARQQDPESEIEALKTALSECWVLCNTLANLSSIHRNRLFGSSGRPGEQQEQAWKSCWSLCKKLYESRDEDSASQARPTLDRCRDFCQALFEVRVRENEAADSVLRVSFELNNHLYNTHDRNLPEAFRERTLDFYITLCHRLMKQKTRLAVETDSLLRACWALAEMLFSLRQNSREGKKPDEELLGSAVQACWELCDLFREGWTQIRPERGTPRPSQTTFSQVMNQTRRPAAATPAIDENIGVPETPTTIFEDTVTGSPEEAPEPNILVFGAEDASSSQPRRSPPQSQQSFRRKTPSPANPARQPSTSFSSASSILSASSQSSSQTASSTSTIRTTTSGGNNGPNPTTNISSHTSTPSPDNSKEETNLLLLKLLFVRAAQTHGGFSLSGSTSFPSFVKSLPPTAFGSAQWQMSLFDNYKRVVIGDPAFQEVGGAFAVGSSVSSTGSSGSSTSTTSRRKATANEVARAVKDMVSSGHFGWLRDLFRMICGFSIEEAGNGKNGKMVIQT